MKKTIPLILLFLLVFAGAFLLGARGRITPPAVLSPEETVAEPMPIEVEQEPSSIPDAPESLPEPPVWLW